MKIVVLIVRLLLGLVFFVFGLNAFLQFLKGPTPGGLAGQFLQALFQSHYVLAIGAVQAVRKRTPFEGDTEVTLATAPVAVSQKTIRFAWKLVDVTGFEPATPCLQSRCSPS